MAASQCRTVPCLERVSPMGVRLRHALRVSATPFWSPTERVVIIRWSRAAAMACCSLSDMILRSDAHLQHRRNHRSREGWAAPPVEMVPGRSSKPSLSPDQSLYWSLRLASQAPSTRARGVEQAKRWVASVDDHQ